MRAVCCHPPHRRSFGLLLTIVVLTLTLGAVTLLVSVPSAHAGAHDAATDLQRVEHLLYQTSMSEFVATVSAGDSWLDTSTDYCSAPLVGTTGRSFDFHGPCRRHDFGYRNLKLLDQRYGPPGTYWNATSRKRSDRQFLADMKAHCHGRPWYDEPTCLAWAATFYAAVRVAGGP